MLLRWFVTVSVKDVVQKLFDGSYLELIASTTTMVILMKMMKIVL